MLATLRRRVGRRRRTGPRAGRPSLPARRPAGLPRCRSPKFRPGWAP